MVNRTKNARKALFLDRDGVINEDRKYVYRVEDLVLLPGVIEAVRVAKQSGYLIILVTNQSGIARGFYKLTDVDTLHSHLNRVFTQAGAGIDAIYICPHHPDGAVPEYAVTCSCRKPKPGMILRAAAELDVELDNSILVGDNCSDIEAAIAAGVGRTCLLTTRPMKVTARRGFRDVNCESLHEYVRLYFA